MNVMLAIIIGILYTAGLYMMLRRSLVKVIIGLVLLGHAANLLIFTLGKMVKGKPSFIAENAQILTEPYSDPVPQALILTAIVIGFGIQAFAIVLYKRTYQTVGSDDIDKLRTTDSLED